MTETLSEPSLGAVPRQADAQLVLQLAQLATGMNVDRGQALLYKHKDAGGLTYEQFRAEYPIDSDDATAILNVLKWHETLATLVKQGLLNRELVYDWLWVAGSWQMCEGVALGQREESGQPRMWENFEELAKGQRD